jgi:hypothetical protein
MTSLCVLPQYLVSRKHTAIGELEPGLEVVIIGERCKIDLVN